MNSICHESNFEIKIERKAKNKNISMYNTSIFIGGRQNLKSKRIHLSTNTRYNNTAHREITNFRNKKNKSVDRVNIELEKSANSEMNEQIDIIKMMNVRWQNNLNISKSDLNIIQKQEKKEVKEEKENEKKEEKEKANLFDMDKYIKDLKERINLNYNLEVNDNNPEYFVLLKMDKFEQNNIFIHEIIAPKSKEDFEKSVDKFIKRKSTQINKDNNTTDSTSSMDTNKKKSKFSKKENKENINNNLKDAGEEFSPIFILNQKDLRDLYYIVEPKKTNRIKMINYEINNFSFDYFPTIKKTILRAVNEPKEVKIEKKYSLYEMNVENLELIQANKTEKKYNYKITTNNSLSILSQYKKEEKEEKEEEKNPIQIQDDIENKEIIPQKKETEDFSQCTPISLLQNKFSVYAVSKWLKYSIPNPQSQIFIKYDYISKRKIISPMDLLMTNFTLWIERIETKRNDNKYSLSISSSANSNFKNNNSQQTGKSLTYNKNRNTKVKLGKNNNYEMGSNGSFIKPINLKTKVFK